MKTPHKRLIYNYFKELLIRFYGTAMTIGLGWSIGNSSVKIPGQSKTYRTESNTFRIPIYVGGMLGDPEKLHVFIRGGVVRNYLVNYKVNDEKQNLSGTDRSSWNGTVKFTIGVRFLNFMVDYEFPFESGGKGAWLFGAHLGL